MKIFSLFFLTFLLVALLGMSLGFPFYGHHRISSNSSEHGQQAQNHGDGNGNSTGRPIGSPPSGTPPTYPAGSSTLLPQ
ncbi:hypothetical protein Ddc_19791 [Ditylenchus destructor]|nr:hypothetical protein Ddc_19791 [Ditylenchus destructor]